MKIESVSYNRFNGSHFHQQTDNYMLDSSFVNIGQHFHVKTVQRIADLLMTTSIAIVLLSVQTSASSKLYKCEIPRTVFNFHK